MTTKETKWRWEQGPLVVAPGFAELSDAQVIATIAKKAAELRADMEWAILNTPTIYNPRFPENLK